MTSQLNSQGETIPLVKRMSRCSNSGFQGLKGLVGLHFVFAFKTPVP